MNNLWFAGVPGSRWSGIHRLLVNACDNVDRTDENDDRRFFHKNANPHNPLNGHSGAYWGPGMGCGEHWMELQKLGTEQIQKISVLYSQALALELLKTISYLDIIT